MPHTLFPKPMYPPKINQSSHFTNSNSTSRLVYGIVLGVPKWLPHSSSNYVRRAYSIFIFLIMIRDETVAEVVKPFVFSQSHTALTSRWRVPPSAAPSTQLYISPVWRLLRHLPGQLGESMPLSSVGWCWAARQLIFRHDLIVKRNYRKAKKKE